MGLFDGFHRKKQEEAARQVQEHLKTSCSIAVDYELFETEDSNFFFATDDSNIPHGSGSKYDRIIQTGQGRAGYHSLIGIHELSRRKDKPTNFGFLICPFSIASDPKFDSILNRLLEKCQYGKKEILLYVFGRSAHTSAKNAGHSDSEILTKASELMGVNWLMFGIDLDIVSAACKEIKALPDLKAEYRSQYCPHCRTNNSEI